MYRIPDIAPGTLERLSPAGRERFMKGRELILSAVYRYLIRPITWNAERQQQKLERLDEFIQTSAMAIANRTRTGFVFTGSIGVGFALSSRLRDRLREKLNTRFGHDRYLRFLPHFYRVYALGFGIYRSTRAANRYEFELVFDRDRLKDVKTFATEVSVAVNWGFSMDRDAHTTASLNSHYVGILGVIRQNPQHFSYQAITGLAIPPYAPVFMIYTNKTRRYTFSITPRIRHRFKVLRRARALRRQRVERSPK